MVQNQKTETTDVDEAWNSLTERQRNFIVNVASGENQTTAYRNAGYSVENMADTSIAVEASRLRNHPKVSLIIDSLIDDTADRARLAQEEYLQRLFRLSLRAEAAGNYGAAVGALKEYGEAAGFRVKKFEDVNETNPMDILRELARIDKPLADKIAKEEGVNYHEGTDTEQ